MYEGEVKIAQADLDEFLQTAADLKVKGLVEENLKHRTEALESQQVNEKAVKHEYNEVYNDDSSPAAHTLLQSYEEIPSRDSTQNCSKYAAIEKHNNIADGHVYSIIPEKGDSLMQYVNGVWKCNVCGKTDRKKSNITSHTEVHVEGAAHICTYCGKTFKTKNSLRVHKYKTHTSDKFIEKLGHVV